MSSSPSRIPGQPQDEVCFAQMGVTEVWRRYADVLTWGRGQTLAILDDGCELSVPEWQAALPWGPKVKATWNSIDGNDDCSPAGPGYHGTSVGYPSSLNYGGRLGVAYNNQVAHVRCVTVVHLEQDESPTLAAALRWVIDRREQHHITAVNLSPVDDQAHAEPHPSRIDEELEALRHLGVWVSAPCANHGYTTGISWPACQPYCFAIGATVPGGQAVHLDRFHNTDLLVPAAATSSSNAYAAASFMVLREAIDKAAYDWHKDAPNLADAALAIFQRTGRHVHDPDTGITFGELDLAAAVDEVFRAGR